jgi:hypothetical protein
MAYERKHPSPLVEAIGKFARKRKARKDSQKATEANEEKVAMKRKIMEAEAKESKRNFMMKSDGGKLKRSVDGVATRGLTRAATKGFGKVG